MTTSKVFVLLMLCLASTLFSNYYNALPFMYDTEIIDARASALGRTSLLSTTGANNIFNNPAITPDINGFDLRLSFKATSGKDEIVFNNIENTLISEKHEYEQKTAYNLNGLSLTIPGSLFLKDTEDFNFAFGLGYKYQYDYKLNDEMNFQFYDYEVTEDFESTGGYDNLVLSYGMKYHKLYAGLSLGIPVIREWDYDWSYKQTNSGDGQYVYTIKDEYSNEVEGMNVNITMMYKILKNMRISFRLTPASSFKYEETRNFVETNEGGNDYSNSFTTRLDKTISIPTTIGFSCDYQWRDILYFVVEYGSRNLGDYEEKTGAMSSTSVYHNCDSGSAFKMGLEYTHFIKARMGFFTQSVPKFEETRKTLDYYNENSNSVFSSTPQRQTGFTFGVGIPILAKYELDFYFEKSVVKNESIDDDSQDSRYDVTEEYNKTRFGITVGANF